MRYLPRFNSVRSVRPAVGVILGCGLGAAICGLAWILGGPLTRAADVDPPKPKPWPRLNPHRTYYGGVITVIEKNSIDIGPGWTASETKGEPGVDPAATKKPKRFSAEGTLVGGDPDVAKDLGSYRWTDLKVGDRVTIDTGLTRGGEELCMSIVITRRPGGKIPPAPNEAFPNHGVHLMYQAEQDWEEKGIPIPAKYCDKNGQAPWTNPPYPANLAPPPREVRPAKP